MVTVSKPTTAPLRRLWWLNPAWPFALIIGTTAILAYFQSEQAYRLYRTPKYMELWHVGLAAGAIFAFVIGSRLAMQTGRVPQPVSDADDRIIHRWFHITTTLSIFGYFAWLLVGVANGFSVSVAVGIVSGTDDKLYEQDFFPTVPGVTTCTQFAMAAAMLGLFLFFRGHRRAIWPVAILLLLAVGRAVFLHERTALIELVVPGCLLALRMCVLGRSWPSWFRTSFRAAPIAGPIILALFFGASEYTRSWRYYQHEFDSYPEFVSWRLTGYYTTALNNGAMTLETNQPRPLPYYTLRSLWLFPGVRSSPFDYTTLTGLDVEENHTQMLKRWGNFELNNEGGLFQPTVDFGIAGALLFWLGYGFVAGRFYRSFQVGTIAGITVYPLIYLSILEVPLVLFILYPRMFPSFAALAAVWWVTRQRASVPGRQPHLPKVSVTA